MDLVFLLDLEEMILNKGGHHTHLASNGHHSSGRVGVKSMDAKHNSAWVNQFSSSGGAFRKPNVETTQIFWSNIASLVLQVALENV